MNQWIEGRKTSTALQQQQQQKYISLKECSEEVHNTIIPSSGTFCDITFQFCVCMYVHDLSLLQFSFQFHLFDVPFSFNQLVFLATLQMWTNDNYFAHEVDRKKRTECYFKYSNALTKIESMT